MSYWFGVAIIAPILWAASTLLDKGLLAWLGEDEDDADPVFVLILYSMLFSLAVLPILFFIADGAVSVFDTYHTSLLLLAGIADAVAVILFLYTLEREDASIVAPFSQTIPIFGFIFGMIFLDEFLTAAQIIGAGIVIFGSMLITADSKAPFAARITTIALALAAAASFAAFDTLFKLATTNAHYWAGLFWVHMGILAVGATICICKPTERMQFIQSVRTSGRAIFSLNVLNEVLYAVGVFLLAWAILHAPIALVSTAAAYQPVFVLIGGLILTRILPRYFNEQLGATNLAFRLFAIVLVVIGGILINI